MKRAAIYTRTENAYAHSSPTIPQRSRQKATFRSRARCAMSRPKNARRPLSRSQPRPTTNWVQERLHSRIVASESSFRIRCAFLYLPTMQVMSRTHAHKSRAQTHTSEWPLLVMVLTRTRWCGGTEYKSRDYCVGGRRGAEYVTRVETLD